jgi:hypothetical protein
VHQAFLSLACSLICWRDVERFCYAFLENWACWNTAAVGSRVAASQTGAICDRLRRAVMVDQNCGDERRKLDENDALLIERNPWKLRGTQRSLLRVHYVNN